MELIVRGDLLEEESSTRSCPVEGETGEEHTLFDQFCARSGEAQGGEMEESDGDGKGLHGG